ncbi:hypothetical protein ACFSC6_11045 [Rufibacter sediminis]|uniref:Uncharacterized protein n=1 Tax=Rufibacter sediminis TaxID=2762756 RepID=A0ABR6VTC5_9BACT|nr:hypothetical protein [Rufibacter sediminis]MBC3540417.1 hypothetical protein [Rufibacter sediminis]
MDLSRAETLGKIERIVNGKTEATDFVLKKSGQFFYLLEVHPNGDYKEWDEGIHLAFHKYEVVEQVEGISWVANDTIDEFPGETFLRYLGSLLTLENELASGQSVRGRQLSEILSRIAEGVDSGVGIKLSLKSPSVYFTFPASITTKEEFEAFISE